VQARAAHRCPAALLVICPGSATARRCRVPIATSHPGFDLAPLVIDSTAIPDPGREAASPELVVLAVLTGALDLDQDSARRLVLATLAGLDTSRLKTYTVFVRSAASEQARQALEALMTTKFKDTFVDRLLAEGKAEGEAEGEARMILRVLAARGLQVPAEIRQRVLSCADTSQLEAWGDRAATAASLDEVFGSCPAPRHRPPDGPRRVSSVTRSGRFPACAAGGSRQSPPIWRSTLPRGLPAPRRVVSAASHSPRPKRWVIRNPGRIRPAFSSVTTSFQAREV